MPNEVLPGSESEKALELSHLWKPLVEGEKLGGLGQSFLKKENGDQHRGDTSK